MSVHRSAPARSTGPTDDLVKREIAAINRTFAEFGVSAGTPPDGTGALVSSTSYISYLLRRGNGQNIAGVEKVLREMEEAISAGRGKPTPVRLESAPLALQVPHPSPRPLRWTAAPSNQVPPHTMLLGQSFSHGGGLTIEKISFDDSPHILVAGTTGAGKSVLMQAMITSLCANTSPEDLQIIMVDLKNEDMIPFATWPHVVRFAGRIEEAVNAIADVVAEKEARIDDGARKPFRLVLWIDELLQLAQERSAVDALGNLASVGRSKLINIVAATQHPTEAGGMGSIMKANFSTRLVGQVAPGQSYAATQRKQLHADMLPGKGSFLRIEGNDARRFQSYLITHGDIDRAGAKLGPRPVNRFEPMPGNEDDDEHTRGDDGDGIEDVIRALWEDGASLAAMIREAYGPHANTGGSNRRNVLRAVENLETTTTTSDEGAFSALSGQNSGSSGSSSSDLGVIKLEKWRKRS